ncbi:hypothetical protein HDU96_002453, partial [Phlyctochytrium bullatum]
SVEVLRTVFLHVQPNDLPTLAAVNRYLRHAVHFCVDTELAKHHIATLDRGRSQRLHFDHPLLFQHTVAAIARYGFLQLGWTFKQPRKKPGVGWTFEQTPEQPATSSMHMSENVRLHRVAVMRTVVEKGFWPSPKFDDFHEQLTEALHTAVDLRSVDLLTDVRQSFPEHFADDLKADPYRTILFECARVGFADALALITYNHPILFEREHSESDRKLMNLAIESGSLESVKVLHELGAPVNDDVLESPLQYAINRGCSPEIIEFLLGHGADTEARFDFNMRTALLSAAWNQQAKGHAQVVKLLILFGADIEARDDQGCTALMHEVSHGHPECVRMLLSEGADINATDWEGKTALGHSSAILGGLYQEAAKVLETHGASVTKAAPLTIPPLYAAIESNDCELIESLIDAGESLCAPNFMSKPPLHFALEKANAEAAVILLAAGADPNARCWEKYTALHWLARCTCGEEEEAEEDAERLLAEDSLRLFGLMLERRVDVNATCKENATALHYAAASGAKELLLQLLRTEGIDLHVLDSTGGTWAHMAGESTETLEWLREHAPAEVWEQMGEDFMWDD